MEIIKDAESLRRYSESKRRAQKSLGMVPTMGNLHAGHLTLLERATAVCDAAIATIFVNPLQFAANEDLEAYPRSLDSDLKALAAGGCDCVFAPAVAEMYGSGTQTSTQVSVPELSQILCGQQRPDHFRGVATIVAKLFVLARPDKAYFGLKDYQQYLIIKRLAADLFLDTHIIGVETVREADGLAMSSRNAYLSERERRIAPELYRAICAMRDALDSGARDFALLEDRAAAHLSAAGFSPEYVRICHADTLAGASGDDRQLVIMAAARLGGARLIDNLRLELPAR